MIFLGIDVGTTGVKALAVGYDGKVLGKGSEEYPLNALGQGRIEQNAEDWFTASAAAVRRACSGIDKDQVVGIGLSTQGATMAFLDKDGKQVRPAITWMDSRAREECKLLDSVIPAEEIYNRCGWGLSAGLDAAKILWLKRHEPENMKETRSFLSTVEYMNLKMTGNAVIDPTNAAIRQLYSIKTGDWDDEILAAVGTDRDHMPAIMSSGACVGELTEEAADAFGLHAGIKVFNGMHDQYAAALGAGAVHSGDMLLSTGTTWVVLGVTDKPAWSPVNARGHVSPGVHPVKGLYGEIASLKTAGSALKWYKDLVSAESFRELDSVASTRRDKTSGLYFCPFLTGAGFPHERPDVQGNLYGLNLSHDKYDIERALLEGVCFEARTMLEEYSKLGINVKRLRMIGGASKSALWSGLVGAITGCEVERMKESEAASMGAAILAAVGSGCYASYTECTEKWLESEPADICDEEERKYYDEKYSRYVRIRDAIMNI